MQRLWTIVFIARCGLILLVAGSPAMTQEFRGTLSGHVTDPSGAVVPNAAVVAVNKDTQQTYSATTTSAGQYQIPYILPGTYTVTVKVPSIKSHSDGMNVLGAVVNHWRVSNVLVAQTGLPEDIPGGMYTSTHSYTPDSGSSIHEWIYNCGGNPTGCWKTSLPPFVLSQNPGRVGTLRRPEVPILNLTLEREFPLTEKWKLQLRGEADNVTNSVLFGEPDRNPFDGPPVKHANGSWTGFGTVAPFQNNFPRIVKVAAKLIF